MSFSHKRKNIKKNKTRKNVKMVGGGIVFTMIPNNMIKDQLNIVKGDMLIADSGFTIELTGKKDGGKVLHTTGFAWDYNYGKDKKWVAVSKTNYQILVKEQETKKELKKKEEEDFDKIQDAEDFERKKRISFIESILLPYKSKNTGIKIRTPELIITNPDKIYELLFKSKRGIKNLERDDIYELKIDIDNVGKKDSNGWFVNGYITKDHYKYITDFEAYNGNKWVIGNYNNIVYSSSKEDFEEFYQLYPEDTFDPTD